MEPVQNLLYIVEIKCLAVMVQVDSIVTRDGYIIILFKKALNNTLSLENFEPEIEKGNKQ